MGWEKIGVLIIGGLALIFFLPRILKRAREAPRGTAKDWMGVLLPVGLVVLFVVFLIAMVRH